MGCEGGEKGKNNKKKNKREEKRREAKEGVGDGERLGRIGEQKQKIKGGGGEIKGREKKYKSNLRREGSDKPPRITDRRKGLPSKVKKGVKENGKHIF